MDTEARTHDLIDLTAEILRYTKQLETDLNVMGACGPSDDAPIIPQRASL